MYSYIICVLKMCTKCEHKQHKINVFEEKSILLSYIIYAINNLRQNTKQKKQMSYKNQTFWKYKIVVLLKSILCNDNALRIRVLSILHEYTTNSGIVRYFANN